MHINYVERLFDPLWFKWDSVDQFDLVQQYTDNNTALYKMDSVLFFVRIATN